MIKRIVLLSILLLNFALFSFAQNPTMQGVGFADKQITIPLGDKQVIFTQATGSQVGASNTFKSVGGQFRVYTGMPMLAQYFGKNFGNDVFVSKGYFADFVQLRWRIISPSAPIKKFFIYRKAQGERGDSTFLATVPADTYAYQDQFAEKGKLYTYTIFAQGISDNLRVNYTNYVQGVGFSTAVGSASGKVTFASGTAVAGVTVSADTKGNLGGKSVKLNGTSFLEVPHDPDLELKNGFTWQAWVKVDDGTTSNAVFSKGLNYGLNYSSRFADSERKVINGRFSGVVGINSALVDFTAPVNTYVHVSFTYDGSNKQIRVFVSSANGVIVSPAVTAQRPPAEGTEPIWMGRFGNSYLNGNMDEIRLWNRPLSQEEITRDYTRYIAGNENGLVGYWDLNTGVGNQFYDLARKDGVYFENHGFLRGAARFDTFIPSVSQLSYRGITDQFGNYTISGFPYETAGSLYTFTPMFNIHQFEPTQQVKFVGDGAGIQNDVNFKDISSFKVSTYVRYKNTRFGDTEFPVEGVSFSVDGQPVANADGELLLTGKNGKVDIDVPIGQHTIKASKSQHTFEEDGLFPAKGAPASLGNFQAPKSIEFYDNTLVKVVGRVVGGPVEEAKTIGFGKSKNNIGVATITMGTEKSNILLVGSQTTQRLFNTTESFNRTSNMTFKGRELEISTDTRNGEYVAYLLPEKYTVTSIRATSGVPFDQSLLKTLDLTSTAETTETVNDTLSAIYVRERTAVTSTSYPRPEDKVFPVASYNGGTSKVIKNTLEVVNGRTTERAVEFTVGKATETFKFKQNFIYRARPTITVTNNSDGTFGETSFNYVNRVNNATTPIQLINPTTKAYSFGRPVFIQRSSYQMNIKVFEEYVNGTIKDQVPVTDGSVEITNAFANDTEKKVLPLNGKGAAVYSFTGGLPETTKNGALSFTRTMTLEAVTGEGGSIRTAWPEFRAYVFGGMPVGNNFVTTGPTLVSAILRDPPGSASSTTLEKGSTVYSTESWSESAAVTGGLQVAVNTGLRTTTLTGVGVAVETSVEVINETTIGVSTEHTWTSAGERRNETTISKTISTSADPQYVGADADVFVGEATNLVYGAALNLTLVPSLSCGSCSDPASPSYIQSGISYKIGIENSLRINPETATSFLYTQGYIKNTLIPNLEKVRNSLLVFPDPAPNYPTDRVIYVSKLPLSDANFGTNNASGATDGTSYKVVVPRSISRPRDEVWYYNTQIKNWKDVLASNEQKKVEARLIENISFDAGASYTNSKTIASETSSSRDYSFIVDESIAPSLGGEFNGFGVQTTISVGSRQTGNKTTGQGSSTSTTYAYTIADTDAGDYMSIDVKDARDGFSPVFYLRAGATQCPFEGAEVTQFFNPGTRLGEATLKREQVGITVTPASVSNVPENRAAEFTLLLGNTSETNEDAWFDLKVDEQSNPDGAVLEIDGLPLGNGRSFFIPGGKSIQKILKVRKGTAKILAYENLKLILGSQCNESVADENKIFKEVLVSAYFQPGCSDIAFAEPKAQWLVNSRSANTTLETVIDSYDVNYDGFRKILFQYKPASQATYLTSYTYFNEANTAAKTEFDALSVDDKRSAALINKRSNIRHVFNMADQLDRSYDIRAVAVCGPNNNQVITPTEVLRGTRDISRPLVFGSPQPSDGILSSGDDISVRFNEPIEGGLLTEANYSVKGVLNDYKINNNTSISLNGINHNVSIPDGLSLSRSFTVEFWLKRNAIGREMVVYSKGNAIADAVQFGFTATNQIFVQVGNQRLVSASNAAITAIYSDTQGWHHYALAYNKADKKMSVYVDDQYALDQLAVTADIGGQGPISIGKSVTGDRFANVNIHEFRIWSDFQSLAKVYAQLRSALTGDEIGLVGYWPMDEAFGKSVFDKARSRSAVLTGDWLVTPRGKSLPFNGSSDVLEINTASTVVISEEMDMTLEFWFNGAVGQTNKTLFASGKGDGTDRLNSGNVSVNVNANGKIQTLINGQELLAGGEKDNFMDNSWHHYALSLKRNATAVVYIDGEQKVSAPAGNLGGLSGRKMYVGARGFIPSQGVETKDRFFNGFIDELRIWKLARKQNQLLLDRNAKLSGSEPGLVAYYPFESFAVSAGVTYTAGTLADQWNNPFGANGGVAQGTANKKNNATDNTVYSENTPNIKDARPVTSVGFTTAVNADQIVITPSASVAAQIEKAVLEITVSGVEDKYGNSLQSPVTWTAFVDRNPLKWDNDNLDISKKLYDKQSFSVKVVNKGGTQQNFNIRNLPAWLTAQPQSGFLAPQSTATVTFTVNEGLNTGYFDEDIYLAGDFGYNEKLQVSLRVFAPEPAWAVDANKFQYSMNVIGQLKINEVISTDAYDKVAAFVNGECRGVAYLKYISQYDQYQAYLDIYSNLESGEAIEFRVWDASSGTEYRDATPNFYTFLSNSIKGSPSAPDMISVGVSALQLVNLESGWNWKSFNVKSDQLANPTNLLKGLNTVTGDIIKGQTSVDVFAPGAGWSGTITSTGGFKNGQLYLMKVSNVGNFEVKGTLLESTFPIPLKEGWNWIGFVPQFNVSVNEALASWQASNGDIVKGKRAFATYQDGLGWIGSLTFMLPGEGYLVRTAKDATLVYPEITSLSAGGRVQLAEDTKQYWPVDAGKAQNNMSVIAKLETDQKDEWVVGAFSGQVCKGFATPASITAEKTLYFLTVHGDQTENMQLKALNKNTGEVRSVKQALSFAPNDAKGTFESPIVLTFGDEKGSTGSELFAYPNPVTDILTVILPQDGQSHKVFFTDLTGRVLRKVEAPENTTKVEISLKEDIATGVYILSVEGGSLMKTVKIVKN
jgi:hypothetical protein